MKVRSLSFVAAALLGLSAFGSAQAQIADHLECYKIKDPLKLEAFVDLDSPQFGVAQNCKVGKAKFFCVPAEKTVLSAVDKATHLPITPLPVAGPDPGDRVCYKVKCPEPFPPGTEITDQFGTRTVTKFKTQMLCAPAIKGTPGPAPTVTPTPTVTVTPRFVDNGDGTVTDKQTGLQWEKKTDDASVHDKDNLYSWSVAANDPNGTVFTSFLVTLNGGVTGVGDCESSDGITQTGGFVGRCDWRLPSIAELSTILDPGVPGCNAPFNVIPCIDPIFGPTVDSYYWSATTVAPSPDVAWAGAFTGGFVSSSTKAFTSYVRAVRAGL